MLPFLQSNLTLVVGAVLAVVLIGLRAASTDKTLRRDVRGALVFLVLFLVLRVLAQAISPFLPLNGVRALTVAWMVMFAFGVIRTVVSIGLWVVRSRSGAPTPKILRDVLDGSLYVLATVPILKSQLEIDLTGLLATSAILSVVLGLALQDTLGNLFAGLSIQVERPFQVGDYVTIGPHSGRVVQMAWRATRLETFRQESITIPNNVLSKEPVKNFSRGAEPMGRDVYLNVSYDTPPNHVKDTVFQVLREIPLVLQDPPAKVRTWAFEDKGIAYQIRFWVSDYLTSDSVMEEIYSRLWYRLRREGIPIAVPYRNVQMLPAPTRQEVDETTVVRLLESVDIFNVLAQQDLHSLAPEMHPRRFGKGERILEQGAAGHTFYLVATGEVSVRAGRPEQEVARLSRGQYFGEMSLLTGEPRAASVVATTDTLLLELDRPVFAKLFAENNNLAKQLSAVLAHRRSELRQASEHAPHPDPVPEANRILHRLKAIFGLAD